MTTPPHLTALLTTSASGAVLPPLFIFSGTCPDCIPASAFHDDEQVYTSFHETGYIWCLPLRSFEDLKASSHRRDQRRRPQRETHHQSSLRPNQKALGGVRESGQKKAQESRNHPSRKKESQKAVQHSQCTSSNQFKEYCKTQAHHISFQSVHAQG